MDDTTPDPEEQLRGLFAAMDGFDHVVATVTGLRSQLIQAGWSEAGAEAIVVAQWQGTLQIHVAAVIAGGTS